MIYLLHEIQKRSHSKVTPLVRKTRYFGEDRVFTKEVYIMASKNATSELIKAASVNRVTDKATGKVLGYLVKSNSSEDYYEVTGKKVNGVCSYNCTCKAGKAKFVNCKNGKCAHVKAVIEVVEIRNQVVSTP